MPLDLAVSMQLRTEVNEGNEDLAWLDDTDPLGGFGHHWVTSLPGEKVERTSIPVLCYLRCLVVKVNSSGLDVLVAKGRASEQEVLPGKDRLWSIVSMLVGLIRANSDYRLHDDSSAA